MNDKMRRFLAAIALVLCAGLLAGPLAQYTKITPSAVVSTQQTAVTDPEITGSEIPGTETTESGTSGTETTEPGTTEAGTTENMEPTAFAGTGTASLYLGNDPDLQEHPTAPERTWIENLDIPAYSGEAYISVNGGQPFFDTENLTPDPWELYYDLDQLGRCTLAEAVAGPETMPTTKRGSISSVKPTGWHTDKYSKDLVNGESLYNRCHLIAFGLCGETANKYNLITGTRYFNTDGINSLENMVIDYIRETGNHVRYRVTPVFTGDNLVADGQLTEAWSIEDQGEGICFCVYSYNVQPGVTIDYATGDNWLSGESRPAKQEKASEAKQLDLLEEDYEGDFVLNVKKMKMHAADCEAAASISEKNRKAYTGSYNELIKEGYEADPACLGFLKE